MNNYKIMMNMIESICDIGHTFPPNTLFNRGYGVWETSIQFPPSRWPSSQILKDGTHGIFGTIYYS